MYSIEEVYPLEVVVKALKANSRLVFNGIDALGCPTKVEKTEMHPKDCGGIPGKCNECQNQECTQWLTIYLDERRIRIIKFKFLIYIKNGSGLIGNGFIHRNDSELGQLTGKEIIKIE